MTQIELLKLGITPDQARRLESALKSAVDENIYYDIDVALELANKLMEGHGVEALREHEFHGYYGDTAFLYVNMGDTYATTLLYDTRQEVFSVGSWGDVVEADMDRFP